jgi:hypothetical protein
MAEQRLKKRDKHRYVKLQVGGKGVSCIVEQRDAADMMKDDPELTASEVWMTVAEFEALENFEGF